MPMLTSLLESYWPDRHRHLQARADDQVLAVVRELLQRERGRPVEVDRQPEPGIGEPVDLARDRLPGELRRPGQPGVGHDGVDLAGLAPEIEHPRVGEDRVGRLELRILHRQRGVERQAASRIGVAGDHEVHADRRVGVGARLDVLRVRGGRTCRERPRGERADRVRRGQNASHADSDGAAATCSSCVLSWRICSRDVSTWSRAQRSGPECGPPSSGRPCVSRDWRLYWDEILVACRKALARSHAPRSRHSARTRFNRRRGRHHWTGPPA